MAFDYKSLPLQFVGAPDRKAPAATTPGIRARYENAFINDENARTFWLADVLSAKSANSYQVRRTLRMRSRQEVSNNPYLWGVCTGNADDLIGTGPTLQVLLPEAKKRQIERAFAEWAYEVELVEKLRTAKLAKTIDGEGFLILKSDRTMTSPVQLYPIDVEADQVTTPQPHALQELWLDGLIVNPTTGRPIAYTVLKHHPGDYFFPGFNLLAYDRIPAKFVIHTFAKWRPGMVRGVPIFTPALDLFAELRAYRKAILRKAQIAASFTVALETEAAADEDGTDTPTPFENVPIDAGLFNVLPGGVKPHLFQSGEPATAYSDFQEKCLGEAIRPLAYPLNLALGTSQKFNFSSAKLDHVNYRNSLDVERAEFNRLVLDKLFAAWLEEAILVSRAGGKADGLIPSDIESVADVPHTWHWSGYAPLDPVSDATADHDRLAHGTMTYQQYWAARGRDWREVMAQQAEERREIESLDLVFGEPLRKTETIKEDETSGKEADVGA